MTVSFPWEVYPLFFLVALPYSSVGHGGASGYLALFALFGLATPAVAPVALLLNILVAATSFVRYRADGHFSLRFLLPFIVLSIPAAFVGGRIPLHHEPFSLLLGIALVLSAARFAFPSTPKPTPSPPTTTTLWKVGLPIGGALGFLAGITGIGGGVFLSPILLLAGWADLKRTAATASAFIVLNSLSGIAGHLTRTSLDVANVLPLAAAVVAGGAVGSYAGTANLSPRMLQRALAVVLLIAGGKLLARII
jgi:uncharacterized membrane protein YfcA